MIDIPPLRIGIFGDTRLARGIAFQVEATPGMNLLWADTETHDLQDKPIDVWVEASGSTIQGAERALSALHSRAHVVLTNPAIDLAIGPLLHATAYENGLIVTSDAGSRHGALAALIQEAHIMGFDVVQAGAVSDENNSKLQMELSTLANSFAYLPPDGGMTGPKVTRLEEALTAFDNESYGDIPRIEFLVAPHLQGSLYLIVEPRSDFPPEQASYLREYHLGCGPRYLLQRPFHLGHLEIAKTILAAAAGQATLSPGTQGCNVYALAQEDIPAGTSINDALTSSQLVGVSSPSHPDQIPFVLLSDDSVLKNKLSKNQPVTFDHLDLPDTPLTHLWIQQLELLEG